MTLEQQTAQLNLAVSESNKGNLAESRRLATEILSFVSMSSEQAEEPWLLFRASVMRLLGINDWKKGDYTLSLEHFNASLTLYKQLSDKEGTAKVNNNIGVVYALLGDYVRALEYFHHALAVNEEIENKLGIATDICSIGNVYQYLSNYVRAFECFRRSLTLYEEMGNNEGIIANIANIGNAYRNLGDYTHALEYYHRALGLNEETGRKEGVAINISNIANIYRDIGDYYRSLQYFRRALTLYVEMGNKDGIANNTGNIGMVYFLLADYSPALDHLHRSLALFEEVTNKDGIARTTANMGIVYANIGNYDRALEYFHRSLELNEETGRKEGIANNAANIGSVYADPNFNRYNPEIAEKYLLNAIGIDEEIGAKLQLFENHNALAKLYEKQKQWEKSLSFYKKYHDLYAEVQSEEVKKQADRYGWERQLAELEQEQQIERLHHDHEKRMMQQRIELQTRDVETTIRELVAKNNLLHEILLDAKRLADFTRGNGVEILEKMTNRLTRNTIKISSVADPNKEWAEENTAFVALLHKKYPDLSGMELKVCALLRMKMTTLNICSALFLSRRTVESHRLSIRKKLGLSKKQDLNTAMGNMAE